MRGKYKKLARVVVSKGYGPRHAFNSQEGEEDLPSPPQENAPLDEEVQAFAGGIDDINDPDFRRRYALAGGGNPRVYRTQGSVFGGRSDPRRSLANQPFAHGSFKGESALNTKEKNYVSFPKSAYAQGLVHGGDRVPITNPDTGLTSYGIAKDVGPGTAGEEATRGVDVSPNLANEIGYTGSGALHVDFSGGQSTEANQGPLDLSSYLQSYGQKSGGAQDYSGGVGPSYITGDTTSQGDFNATQPQGEQGYDPGPFDPRDIPFQAAISQYPLIAGDPTAASIQAASHSFPGDVGSMSPYDPSAPYGQGGQDQSQQGGGGGTFNLGDVPVSNLSDRPPDTGGGLQQGSQGGGGLQVVNDLGYNPSYPYGSSGSGVPTQKAAGVGGGVVGSVLGNLLLPGLGGIVGGKLGAVGSRMFTRWLQQQGQGGGGQPGVPQPAPAQDTGGKGGSAFPSDLGGFGQPMGYFPWYDPGNTGSSSYAPFTGGVAGEGGTLAGGSNIGAGPLPGSFEGLGAGAGGNLGSIGGDFTFHAAQPFLGGQTWAQVAKDPSSSFYGFSLSGSPGGAVSGNRNLLSAKAEGDSDVKEKKVAGAGHDFAESKQLWDRIQSALWSTQIPAEMLGPVPEKDDENEEPLMAQKGKIAVEKGYGPRHAFNAQEGNEAVPEELPSPPVREGPYFPEPVQRLAHGMRRSVAQVGSELAGMSKEDYAKLAISMLAGGEELPLGEAGAVPAHIWNSWEPVMGAGTVGKVPVSPSEEMTFQTRRDEAGNHYQQIGLHQTGEGADRVRNVIVQPVEGDAKGKISVAKGFGPTHAENSQEGTEPALTRARYSTDTVPAMLTPREAVLNRNAAELLGRKKIRKVNAVGNKLAEEGVDLAAKGDDSVEVPTGISEQEAAPYVVPKTSASTAPDQPTAQEKANLLGALKAGGIRYITADDQDDHPDPVPETEHEKAARNAQHQYQAKGTEKVMKKTRKYQGGTGAVNDPLSMYQNKMANTPQPGGIPTPGPGPMPAPITGNTRGTPQPGGPPTPPARPDRPPSSDLINGQTMNQVMQSKMGPNLFSTLGPQLQAQAQANPVSYNTPAGTQPQQGFGWSTTPLPPAQPPTPGYVNSMGGSTYDPYSTGALPAGQSPPGAPSMGSIYQQFSSQAAPVLPMFSPSTYQPLIGQGSTPGAISYGDPGGGSFYPPPNPATQPKGYQSGAGDIGSVPPAQNWQPQSLSAGNLDIAKLKQLAQRQGLTPQQTNAIVSQMAQLRAGQNTGDAVTDQPIPAYQSGISDIGYPPMIGPNMEFHGDKGGWIGQMDQQYLVPRYWRGTGSVNPMVGAGALGLPGPVLGAIHRQRMGGGVPMLRHTFPGTAHPTGMPPIGPPPRPSAGILPIKL